MKLSAIIHYTISCIPVVSFVLSLNAFLLHMLFSNAFPPIHRPSRQVADMTFMRISTRWTNYLRLQYCCNHEYYRKHVDIESLKRDAKSSDVVFGKLQISEKHRSATRTNVYLSKLHPLTKTPSMKTSASMSSAAFKVHKRVVGESA